MERETAELSSISTQLDALAQRVTTAAERFDGGDREDVANDLFEVERALRMALRRLARAGRSLRT